MYLKVACKCSVGLECPADWVMLIWYDDGVREITVELRVGRPCSAVIKGRKPCAKDPNLDYEVMSDEEWEEEPEGESLSVSLPKLLTRTCCL